MKCLKAFGERIASRNPDRQTAEVQIRVALINRFNALGTAEIKHVARDQWERGHVGLLSDFCNNAGHNRKRGPQNDLAMVNQPYRLDTVASGSACLANNRCARELG